MIEFKDLAKVYNSGGQKVHAINGINLKIEKGEIFGVIGFSGAGKSSLIRCVNWLEQPTSGTVFIEDKNLSLLSPQEIRSVKKDIGMIFQHFNLLNSKTIYTNVAMPLILAKTPKDEIDKRVKELLEFVGLEDKADKYPDQLSGGQKQRVGIARALATRPSILLCDEATSALDPQTTSQILELLKKVNKEYNITILIITHEMGVIREICDRVAVIEAGKILEQGTVFDIFSNPQEETTKNFVSSVMNDKIPAFLKEILSKENHTQKIYRINFIGTSSGQPLISDIAKTFDVHINILFGNITELQGIPFGNLIVEFIGSDDEIYNAVKKIRSQEVLITQLKLDN